MERRNPLLTAPHYPDLGSASDCESKFPARHDQSEAPPRSGRNALTALVSQTSFRGETSGGAAKCRLFSFATVIFGSLLTLIVTSWPFSCTKSIRMCLGRGTLMVITSQNLPRKVSEIVIYNSMRIVYRIYYSWFCNHVVRQPFWASIQQNFFLTKDLHETGV